MYRYETEQLEEYVEGASGFMASAAASDGVGSRQFEARLLGPRPRSRATAKIAVQVLVSADPDDDKVQQAHLFLCNAGLDLGRRGGETVSV